MSSAKVSIPVLVVAFATACSYESKAPDSPPEVCGPPPVHFGGHDLPLRNARFSGTYGTAPRFLCPTPDAIVSGSPHKTMYLGALSRSGGWAAMILFELDPISFDEIVPGAIFEGSDRLPFTTTFGCTGPAPGDWDYDGWPEDMVVEISDGSAPGDVRFDIEATMEGGGEAVVSFEMPAPTVPDDYWYY